MTNLITFNARDTKRIVTQYAKKGATLVGLAEMFGVSITVIRRVLVDAGVTIRKPGPQGN